MNAENDELSTLAEAAVKEMEGARTWANVCLLLAGGALIIGILPPISPGETSILGRVVLPIIFVGIAAIVFNCAVAPAALLQHCRQEPPQPAALSSPRKKDRSKPTEVTRTDVDNMKAKIVSLINKRDAELVAADQPGKSDEVVAEEVEGINQRYQKLINEL